MSNRGIVLYYTSITSTREIRDSQHRIQQILDGKKIPYEMIDVAGSEDDKDEMRRICDDPTALAPQICNGNLYCGNFNSFDDAVEDEKLEEFLKLK